MSRAFYALVVLLAVVLLFLALRQGLVHGYVKTVTIAPNATLVVSG